jgi:putative PIN family toxin of toxin-antitoxin system
MLRVVLDTNQLVAALSRPPQLATFVMAWESRRFVVVASPELLSEYEYVLDYPEIAQLVEPELMRAFRSHLFQEIEIVSLPEVPEVPPVCRDPDDDKVIATAIVGQADYLVTEDGDLQTHTVRAVLAESGVSVASMRELTAQLDRLTE